jgi:hypothetical protein
MSKQQKAHLKRCANLSNLLAPQVGLEPTTLRLTAECSAIELLRNILFCDVLELLFPNDE